MSLHVLPNAPKTQIIGQHGDALKIKIQAPPVDGKANQEIIRFFAEALRIPKNQIEIVSGEISKTKKLRLIGCRWDQVRSTLSLPE